MMSWGKVLIQWIMFIKLLIDKAIHKWKTWIRAMDLWIRICIKYPIFRTRKIIISSLIQSLKEARLKILAKEIQMSPKIILGSNVELLQMLLIKAPILNLGSREHQVTIHQEEIYNSNLFEKTSKAK